MAVTENVQGVERQNRDQFAKKAEREGERKPPEENISAYANLTIRRDDYHRIPYFI